MNTNNPYIKQYSSATQRLLKPQIENFFAEEFTCTMEPWRLTTTWWKTPSARWHLVKNYLSQVHTKPPSTPPWLTWVLANILQTKYNDVPSFYPQNFCNK